MPHPYSVRHQLILLYLDGQNPVWDRLRRLLRTHLKRLDSGEAINWDAVRLTTKHVSVLAGISDSAIANWRNLRSADPRKFGFSLCAVERWSRRWTPKTQAEASELAALVAVEARYREAYEEERSSLDDYAGILSMDAATCRRICDYPVYVSRPLLADAYYAPTSLHGPDGTHHVDLYKGVYSLWIRRRRLWLRAALEVRYLLELPGAGFIRCKLNFPALDPEFQRQNSRRTLTDAADGAPAFFEYDGYLAVRAHHLCFTFEKRERLRSDYLHIITRSASFEAEGYTVAGRCLTMDQDQHQSVVTGSVLLRRATMEEAGSSDAQRRQFLRAHPARLAPGDPGYDEAQALWRRHRGSTRLASATELPRSPGSAGL